MTTPPTPEVEARRAQLVESLTDLARLIVRADAEASRLRARRLEVWVEARRGGLSWREIARASGMSDHASVAKAVGKRRGEIDA